MKTSSRNINITNMSEKELKSAIDKILAEDIVLVTEGARTKGEREWLESDSWTYASPQALRRRKVDPSLPTILIFYKRISKMTDESVTFERQHKENIRLAKADGFTDEQIANAIVFEEEGSAYLRKHRPKFTAMMKFIKRFMGANPISVYFYEVSRISRDVTVANKTFDAFYQASVSVRIAQQPQIDLNNDQSRMFLPMLIQFAHNASKETSKRTEGGHSTRAEEGIWRVSAPPYGYATGKKMTKLGERTTLVPDETIAFDDKSTAWVVNKIYELYDAGTSMTGIVQWLNEKQIKPRRRKFWVEAVLQQMLRNPHYAGYMRYNPKNEDGERKKMTEVFDQIVKDEAGNYLVTHEAIVDPELWMRVQLKLIKKHKPRVEQHTVHRLSGLLRCANCGRRMYGFANVGHSRSYRCQSSYALPKDGVEEERECVPNNFIAEGLEEVVYRLVDSLIKQPEVLRALSVQKIEADEEDQKKLDELRNQIVQYNTQLTDETDRLQQVGLTAILSELNAEYERLSQREIVNTQLALAALDSPAEFKKAWDSGDKAAISLALRHIFASIEIIPIKLAGRRLNHHAMKTRKWLCDYDRVVFSYHNGERFTLADLHKQHEDLLNR